MRSRISTIYKISTMTSRIYTIYKISRITLTTVVREHPLPNRSGSGDPDLQGGCSLPAKRMARETRSPARVAGEGPSPT